MKHIKKLIAAIYLFVLRWRPEGERPREAKYVLVAAPHTSNWDAFHIIALGWWYDVPFAWFVKHTAMWGPLGWAIRACGGIGVDRRAPQNMVARVVEEFAARRELALVVPPEGSRHRVAYWRSGFMIIAREARVPLVLGYLDYARRRGGFGPTVHPSGDLRADMEILRAFYADKQGRFPDLFTPPLLRAELEDPEAPSAPVDLDTDDITDPRSPLHPTTDAR